MTNITTDAEMLDRWLERNQHGSDYDAEVLEIVPERLRAEYERRLTAQIARRRFESEDDIEYGRR